MTESSLTATHRGKNHHTHKGCWITPWGKFSCIREAIANCPNKVGHDAIRSWCLLNNLTPISRSVTDIKRIKWHNNPI